MSDECPGVSVVMPVRNEERHLREAVSQVLAQQYDGPIEVLVAVAPSTDHTEVITEQLSRTDSRIRLVPNPDRLTSAGLNAAVRQARYDVIVRVDGHGVLSPGYIETAVDVLTETGAANVGGVMHAEGDTPFEQAVAHAYRSRVGLGGGRYHLGGEPGPADSVYLGVFRRSALDQVGGFDEHFARAQDWELNYRLARAGETVWFTPRLWVSYRPRNSWAGLVEQFFRTGRWRREVMRRYPETANVRYLAPPVVVLASVAGVVVGSVNAVTRTRWAAAGWLLPAGYAVGVCAAGLLDGRGLPPAVRARLPGVLAGMHLSWGAGFLLGVRNRTARPGRGRVGATRLP